MVDDITSDSESTSTCNDSEVSDKCESTLFVPGNTDTQMVDKTIKESEKSLCTRLSLTRLFSMRDLTSLNDEILRARNRNMRNALKYFSEN